MEMTTMWGQTVPVSDRFGFLAALWQDLAKRELCPTGVPVVFADRHDVPELRDMPGRYNTTFFSWLKRGQQWVIVLALDTLQPLDEDIAAHELGHQIMAMQGFQDLENPRDATDMLAAFLNSVVHHVPLRCLLARGGFDTTPHDDERADALLRVIAKGGFPPDLSRDEVALNAMHCADLLLGCSPERAKKLREAVAVFPSISAPLDLVLSTVEHYDLHDPDGALKALLRLAKTLGLSKWALRSVDARRQYRERMRSNP